MTSIPGHFLELQDHIPPKPVVADRVCPVFACRKTGRLSELHPRSPEASSAVARSRVAETIGHSSSRPDPADLPLSSGSGPFFPTAPMRQPAKTCRASVCSSTRIVAPSSASVVGNNDEGSSRDVGEVSQGFGFSLLM